MPLPTTDSSKCPSLIKPPQQTKHLCLCRTTPLETFLVQGLCFPSCPCSGVTPCSPNGAFLELFLVCLFLRWRGCDDCCLDTPGDCCVLLRSLHSTLKGVLVLAALPLRAARLYFRAPLVLHIPMAADVLPARWT